MEEWDCERCGSTEGGFTKLEGSSDCFCATCGYPLGEVLADDTNAEFPDLRDPDPRPLPGDLLDLKPETLHEARAWLHKLVAQLLQARVDYHDARELAEDYADEIGRLRDENFKLRARMTAIQVLSADG